MGFIYKIENLINHQIYIGQTIRNVQVRFDEHLRSNLKDSLHTDLRKLGKENFSMSIIEECDNDLLNEKEQYWINYYDSYRHGYNKTLGGNQTDYTFIKKPVKQFTLNGEFIKEYESVADAARALKDESQTSNIAYCCKGKLTQTHKYIYLYSDMCTSDFIKSRVELANKVSHHGNQPVDQLDLDGNYIQTFSTLTEAKNFIGAKSITSITNVCKGRSKTGYGYKWRYSLNPGIVKEDL